MTGTSQNEDSKSPITAGSILKLIANMPPWPQDPLGGATVLHVHPDRRNDALRINEAAGGRLHIQTSALASPKVIAGFKGDDCVVLIKIEGEKS